MPAPPARNRSASVPCGISSRSSSPAEHLALELLVLADVGSHDLFHLPGGEEHAHAEAIHARVVADDGEAFHPAVVQGGDQIFRNAAEPEPAGGDRHVVVEQAVERRLGVGVNFAHVDRKLNHELHERARMKSFCHADDASSLERSRRCSVGCGRLMAASGQPE